MMTDADTRETDPPATRGLHRGPLLVAGVVLLLWLVWLLVPGSLRHELLAGGSEPEGATVIATARAQGTPPGSATEPTPSFEPSAEASQPEVQAAPAAEAPVPVESAGPVAPPDVVVPASGSGVFAIAPGTSQLVGSGALVTYTVEVEEGIALDPAEVAAIVDGTFADPRSWTSRGEWALQRVDAGGDARIRIATPGTSDALCAPLDTAGIYSCRNGDDVVLNAMRWTEGADSWGDDLVGYRGYLANHEFGHYLGNGHVDCPAAGQPAPVMMQQTKTVGDCLPNAWPYP